MSFFTNTVGVSTPLQRIARMAGDISGWTSYTSRMRSTKITSEHLGAPNQLITVSGLAFVIVPHGKGVVTVLWEMDHKKKGQGTFTFEPNPFGYKILSDDFFLVAASGDEGSSELTDDDDRYTLGRQVNMGTGKVFEYEIQMAGDTQLEFLGIEIEAKLAGRQLAYIGGEY
jgi:hypothetical protein